VRRRAFQTPWQPMAVLRSLWGSATPARNHMEAFTSGYARCKRQLAAQRNKAERVGAGGFYYATGACPARIIERPVFWPRRVMAGLDWRALTARCDQQQHRKSESCFRASPSWPPTCYGSASGEERRGRAYHWRSERSQFSNSGTLEREGLMM